MSDESKPKLYEDEPVHLGPITDEELEAFDVGRRVWLELKVAPQNGFLCRDIRKAAIFQPVGTDLAKPPKWGLWERVR